MPAENRNENYRRLRRAGFTSVEANRFKDYSTEYIDKLINLQKLYREDMQRKLKELGMKYHGEQYKYENE